MKKLLSIKNIKLGFIHSFSIFNPSCVNRPCFKHCYMNKLKRLYPALSKKMIYNYDISLRKDFKDILKRELEDSTDIIRLHVDGDFYNQRYLNDIIQIVKSYPQKTFYTYTKSYNLDFSKRPKNLIVYISDNSGRLKKQYKRFDGVARVSFDRKKIKGFIQCPHDNDKNITCNKCRLCSKRNKKVYFNLRR